jgi:ankyrin repeat protein
LQLHTACKYGHLHLVEYLTISVKPTNFHICAAIQNNHFEVVKFLCKFIPAIEITNIKHIFITNMDMVDYLAQYVDVEQFFISACKCVNKRLIYTLSKYIKRPLSFNIGADANLFKYLIANNLLDIKNAVLIACKHGYLDFVEKYPQYYDHVFQVMHSGYNIDVFKYLLPHIQDTREILENAIKNNNLEIIKLLITRDNAYYILTRLCEFSLKKVVQYVCEYIGDEESLINAIHVAYHHSNYACAQMLHKYISTTGLIFIAKHHGIKFMRKKYLREMLPFYENQGDTRMVNAIKHVIFKLPTD